MLNSQMVFRHLHKIELKMKTINKRCEDETGKLAYHVMEIIKIGIHPGPNCLCRDKNELLVKCDEIEDVLSTMISLNEEPQLSKMLDDCVKYLEMIRIES